MRLVGFAGSGGMIYTIIVAVIGAVILTWVVRLVTGKKIGTVMTGCSNRQKPANLAGFAVSSG